MKLFIGCSSSNNIPSEYLSDCKEYLNTLLVSNDIVFGACSTGLMGISYKTAKANGNKVTGICPKVYKDDLLGLNCDEEELTTSISDRTDKVIANSDALIFLPGGIGTIYELFTAIESKRNHEFDKPIVIYNSHQYFDRLLEFLEVMYQQGFTAEKVKECYHISNSATDTLDYLKKYNYCKKLVKRI